MWYFQCCNANRSPVNHSQQALQSRIHGNLHPTTIISQIAFKYHSIFGNVVFCYRLKRVKVFCYRLKRLKVFCYPSRRAKVFVTNTKSYEFWSLIEICSILEISHSTNNNSKFYIKWSPPLRFCNINSLIIYKTVHFSSK
jgi:hypothetical protein